LTGARRWLHRVVALLALAAAAAAIVVAIESVHQSHDVTGAEAAAAMARLAGANRALSSQLAALRTGASPKPAQQAARAAAALTGSLARDLGTGGDLGAAAHAALAAERAYLDAAGSTLNNPRSVLLGQVASRAQALRSALDVTPGGVPQAVSGAATLVAYSRARGGG
jgi:hypothetical protein